MTRLSIFLLVCISINASSQTWAPFPLDETSEWSVWESDFTGLCWETWLYNYQVNGTHVINEQEYVFLSGEGTHQSQNANGNYPECIVPLHTISCGGFIRAEEGKYYKPYAKGQEELLFDFTLSVGDTLFREGRDFVIDSTDQIDVNGNMCIRQWVSEYPETPIWIIEGVGHQYGIFQPIHQFENGSTICYRENGVPFAYYPDGYSCNFLDTPEDVSEMVLQIFPNPTLGMFRITTPQPSTYRIYSLFGRMIQEGQLDGASEIDITDQPSGVYLLSVENEKGISTAKLVKQ